jgi:hypothetical protein
MYAWRRGTDRGSLTEANVAVNEYVDIELAARCRRRAIAGCGLADRKVVDLTNAEILKLKMIEDSYRLEVGLPPTLTQDALLDLLARAKFLPDGKPLALDQEPA